MESNKSGMTIRLNSVHGLYTALYGLGKAYRITSGLTFEQYLCDVELHNRMIGIAKKLFKDNPALRPEYTQAERQWAKSYHLDYTIKAPRYFWIDFDKYHEGVEMQSESSKYHLTHKLLTKEDFVPEVTEDHIEKLNFYIKYYMDSKDDEERKSQYRFIKANLPEGYLQERVVSISLLALKNIYHQRVKHPLDEWKEFCKFIYNDLKQWVE